MFHFPQTLKSLLVGTKVGLVVLSEAFTLTMTGAGQAELSAANHAEHAYHGSPNKQPVNNLIQQTQAAAACSCNKASCSCMQLQVKDNETSIALRIICDGGAIEVFAMHGRAGVSARAAKSSGEVGVVLAEELGAVAPPSVDVAVFPLAFPKGRSQDWSGSRKTRKER